MRSYEKNPDVIWLRSLNPWSPQDSAPVDADAGRHRRADRRRCRTTRSTRCCTIRRASASPASCIRRSFYDHLARVLKRKGRLFHYTGAPNKLTSGRDVPNEVATRLRRAGFATELKLDGVLAVNQRSPR